VRNDSVDTATIVPHSNVFGDIEYGWRESEDAVVTSSVLAGSEPVTTDEAATIWDRAVTAAGLDGLTPHELRHACASLMHDAGADLMVSRQLGHESPAVTGRVYVGLFDDAADEVMERLDRRHSEAAAPPGAPRARSRVGR